MRRYQKRMKKKIHKIYQVAAIKGGKGVVVEEETQITTKREILMTMMKRRMKRMEKEEKVKLKGG